MRIVCVFTTYIMRIYFVYYKIYKITKRTGKLRILFGQNVNCKSILNNIQYIHSKQQTKYKGVIKMKELVRSNDKEFKVTSLEDAKYFFIPDLIDYEGVTGLEEYYEELKNAESLEDFADIWNRNTDKYEDGSTLEVIRISSRDLMQPGENLGWCAPYVIDDENIKFALNEGEITSIMVNGKEESPEGRNVSELLEKAEETGCTNCPWFEKCAAFDDADNMED